MRQRARPDLWEPWEGNLPGRPDRAETGGRRRLLQTLDGVSCERHISREFKDFQVAKQPYL